MNDTIRYYNNEAENYYRSTSGVDFSEVYDRFLKYIPEHGSIIDVGCGSGRDAAAFAARGYQAIGLDASEELAKIAEEKTGIQIVVCDMTTWIAEEPFDGIWCCASLLHLHDDELHKFFSHLKKNLKRGGAMFISVKSGIETEVDEKNRYMRNFTNKEIEDILKRADVKIVERWETRDQLNRNDFFWINVIGILE